MMNTIAEEGTSLDGREVTMTVQEREKTDAGMTGTTGKREVESSEYYASQQHNVFTLSFPYLFSVFWIYFTGSGTGGGNDVAVETTGIMTEVVGRDSPHQDMTSAPSRNAWEEIGEIGSSDDAHFFLMVSAFSKILNLLLAGMTMVETLTVGDMIWVMVVEGGPAMAHRSTGAILTCISCSLTMASPFRQGERWNYGPEILQLCIALRFNTNFLK